MRKEWITFSLFSDNRKKRKKNSTKDRYNVKKKLKMSGCPYIHFGEPLVFVFI